MSSYPNSVPVLTNPDSINKLGESVPPHSQQHIKLNDEVEAVCTELGLNPRGTDASVRARLDRIESSGLSLSDVYPVGCIYTTVVATNPNILFGFGTWTAYGSGRVLVGFDGTQTEFDTVGEQGGSKTHTLTVAETPAHTHFGAKLESAPAEITVDSTHSFTTSKSGGTDTKYALSNSATGGSTANVGLTSSVGSGDPHNNLQPYIVVYFFRRTA